jgi:hypothetical protein
VILHSFSIHLVSELGFCFWWFFFFIFIQIMLGLWTYSYLTHLNNSRLFSKVLVPIKLPLIVGESCTCFIYNWYDLIFKCLV